MLWVHREGQDRLGGMSETFSDNLQRWGGELKGHPRQWEDLAIP